MSIGQIRNTAPTGAVGATNDRKTQASPKQATGSAQPPAAEESATVELSPAASVLSEASQDPSFDQAKVDALAQAIRDGKFTVDHGAIADKLIGNAAELLGRAGSSH